MNRKNIRTSLMAVAMLGAMVPVVLADILVVTVGADTGKILDTEIVKDGKAELTVKAIYVPGK